jgi:large subunit ribosomal protein L18
MENSKEERINKRRVRIRKRVIGTANRPRLSVRFSGKHIYAQCIDDGSGRTLVFLSTLAEEQRRAKLSANVAGAASLGEFFGKKAISSGITHVVFDRGGRKYHGRVKVFADAARGAGLLF